MSVIKTIELFVKNNFSKTEKETKDLNEELGKTAKAQDEVNKSFDAGATFADRYGKELEPLTTRLGEAEDRLYELALAGDTTSKEYQELLTKVGEYRKVQIQTDLAVDGASKTMTQKLGSALNGVTSAFAATQGAMALFGSENEALEESLLKVQSALAIQQGVQGLTEAYKDLGIGTKLASVAQAGFSFVMGGTTKGLKLFRLALLSTGIGAIVVGLGLLIANFEKVSKFVGDAIDSFDKLGGVMKIILFPITAIIEGFKLAKKGLQALGVIESQEEKARKARQEAQIAREQKLLELQVARAKQARQNAEAAREANISLEQLLEKQGKGEEARLRKRERLNKELNEAIFNFDSETQDKIRIALIELDEEEAQILKDKQQRYRDYRDLRLQISRQIEDLENELLEEGIEKELEINRDKFRRLREDAEKNTKLTSDERKKLLALFTEQEEKAVAEIRKKYYDEEKSDKVELLNFVDETNKAEVEKEKAKNLAILDNAVETNKKIIESDKAVAQAKKDIQDAQIANVEAGIALFKDLAGENNKLQALAIAAENAVGIAKIIISTQAANAAAKLKYAAIPGGLALAAAEITANKISAGIGIAASIAAAAKGIASLKQSAPLDSGGDLGGGGVGSETIAPEFNVVGDAGINQLAQLQQQPTQAYVVSGEVTSAQALDRNRVTNATL